MAETLLEFPALVAGPDGAEYIARACGGQQPDGMWHGWLEFVPVSNDAPIRTSRETTQPNRDDLAYWAGGLTHVYLEGALLRALNPTRVASPDRPSPPAFDGPAPPLTPVRGDEYPTTSVLDPFSVYEKGESLLRKQLAALSAWHLVNIAVDYELSQQDRRTLSQQPEAALIDLIVDGVRRRIEAAQPSGEPPQPGHRGRSSAGPRHARH